MSARHACLVVRATRSSVYYRSRKDPLIALRQRMRELAQNAGAVRVSPPPGAAAHISDNDLREAARRLDAAVSASRAQ